MTDGGVESGWVSVGRLVFRLPDGWQPAAEMTYRLPGQPKQYLAWSEVALDAGTVTDWLQERRQGLCQALGREDVGAVGKLSHPRWEVEGFTADVADDHAEQRLGFHVISKPGRALVLRSRLSTERSTDVESVLTSLAPHEFGTRPVRGRYVVYGCSFGSGLGWLAPTTTHANSPDFLTRLDVAWRDAKTSFGEPDWDRLCPSEAPVRVGERRTKVLETGTRSPAISAGFRRLVLETVEATAIATVEGEQVELTWCQAQATSDGGCAWMQLKGRGSSAEALSAWQQVVSTLQVDSEGSGNV